LTQILGQPCEFQVVAGAGAVTPRSCVRPAAAGYTVTEDSLDAYDLQV
jgi:hypothetical protein